MSDLLKAVTTLTQIVSAQSHPPSQAFQQPQRQILQRPPPPSNYQHQHQGQESTPGGVLSNPPQTWQNRLVPGPQACVFCGNPDHFIKRCPEVEPYIRNGKCIWNQYGKISLPDGLQPPRSTPGITLKDRMDNHYRNFEKESESKHVRAEANFLEGIDENVFSFEVNLKHDSPPLSPSASEQEERFQAIVAQMEEWKAEALAIQPSRRQRFDGVQPPRRTGPPRRDPQQSPPVLKNDSRAPPPHMNPIDPPSAPNVFGRQGARAGAPPQRPQGPMKPVDLPPKPMDDSKHRYQAAIESSVKTSDLADQALDTKITISTRELLAASPDV
jgi:hypothetical protein